VSGTVIAVSLSVERGVSKTPQDSIELVAGEGVAGDIHRGRNIRHLARMLRDPKQPNLRQVHLINAELLEELTRDGKSVLAGQMGENVLLRGVDLLGLSGNTVLTLGDAAQVRITGLRNPCKALEELHSGLMRAVLACTPGGSPAPRAGVMAVVTRSGTVLPGDRVVIAERPAEARPLAPV
jgi:MOSC domain-containing protein YiiM